MVWLDLLKSIVYGIVEGISEWLPISSTGHLILLERILPLSQGEAFFRVFLIVIQLGAILAVVTLYWKELWPLEKRQGRLTVPADKLQLWGKILAACVPAAVIGLLFDEAIDRLFYNAWTVAIMLILVGVLFLVAEHYNQGRKPVTLRVADISWRTAILVGVFQVVAAVLPGTSRSGATILGGLLLGLSRPVAAKFTFFLAVPVMLGASLLRLLRSGLGFGLAAWLVLFVGAGVAYLVSVLAIGFLMNFIRKHDFRVFGWYRIGLGLLVLLVFLLVG